jgi:SAM-dependent methyltransferase
VEASEYDRIAHLEDRHWWYVGMRQIAAGLLRGLALGPRARILDGGCGTGGGLRWLSAFGTVTGIDLHPLAVHHASRVSRRLAQASVVALPFADASFDLVTSFDVLYHLAVSDDVAALHEFARVLRPGGWLLVRVPAYDWLRGPHDRQVHTRHRYAPRELRQVIEATGLALRRLSGMGLVLLPAAVVRRALRRNRAAASEVVLPPRPVNWLLARLLTAELLWLRYRDVPLGLSLVALARKPEEP